MSQTFPTVESLEGLGLEEREEILAQYSRDLDVSKLLLKRLLIQRDLRKVNLELIQKTTSGSFSLDSDHILVSLSNEITEMTKIIEKYQRYNEELYKFHIELRSM